MAAQAHSASTAAPYDVFLSFRGTDTRLGFVGHLYVLLRHEGIRVFMDDDEYLEQGQSISLPLLRVIEESRISIVILSQQYADSTWCLDEVAKCVECRKLMGQTVLPVFYDVNPSDVREQTGSFSMAFAQHEQVFRNNIERVQTWRAALTEVANLAGFDMTEEYDGYEGRFIRKIVTSVVRTIHQTVPVVARHLVGIESRVKDITVLLDLGSNDIRFIGIWGRGGIGKTTIARAVYNELFFRFEVCAFVSDIHVRCLRQGDLLQLQVDLLSQALMQKQINVPNVNDGATMIKNSLCNRKVLLLLDDVDNFDELESLAGDKDWFGLGSRIIITTRNVELLRKHGVEDTYEVKELSDKESLQLFNYSAFEKDKPPEEYLGLSNLVAKFARGLPLALRILGSSLKHGNGQELENFYKKLEANSETGIIDVLKVSYDSLDVKEKRIFLDIACFFKGMDKERVEEILDFFGFNSMEGIQDLVDRGLVTISNNKVLMHDLLREMGQKIVLTESVEPGERSRLWLLDDITYVLTNNKGTNRVQGIALDLPKLKEACWNLEAFSEMHNLRFLQIRNLQMAEGPKYLSNSLIFLEWSGYPSKSLPRGFQPPELCELNLCHSSIGQLWKDIQRLDKLKFVNVSYSQNLTRTPDFTVTPNLHRLILEGCANLVEVHPSIAELKRLTMLNLKDCRSLRSLPDYLKMESLEVLMLSGCSNIKKIPEFVRPMEHLSELSFDKTAIEQLPSSIDCLTGLTLLNLRDCRNLDYLTSNICKLRSLKCLNLSGCSKLKELPEHLGRIVGLEKLDVGGTSISALPLSIRNLKNLKVLSLCGCNLQEVTSLENLGFLSSLVSLNLSNNNFVSLPKSIRNLCKLQHLNLGSCKSLRKLPDLSAQMSLGIGGQGSYSVERLSSCFSFINCSKVVDNEGCSNIAFAMLKRFLEGIPYAGNRFEATYPGNEISEWFSYYSSGPVVSMDLRQHWYKNKWMGYALCVVFDLRQRLRPNRLGKMTYGNYSTTHGLRCEVKPSNLGAGSCYPILSCSEELGQIESEHIWLSFVTGDYFGTSWQDSCHHIEFSFKILGLGLEVKRCSVRFVYGEDIAGIKSCFQ